MLQSGYTQLSKGSETVDLTNMGKQVRKLKSNTHTHSIKNRNQQADMNGSENTHYNYTK